MNRPSPRSRHDGFTLVEMLVVIVIIGILVALLIPALAGAVRSARNAQASAEINNMAAALAQFKSQYGDYPPSRVLLSESGSYPIGSATVVTDSSIPWYGGGGPKTGAMAAADITLGVLAQRSLHALQTMFPKASLMPNTTWDQNKDGTADYWPDFNGNGVQDEGYIYLEGHECLVFFLGGMPQPTGPAGGSGGATFQIGDGMVGFGKDPRYPFKYSTTIGAGGANLMATGNRTQPMYEFLANRLVDEDGDGIPGYVDNFHNAPEMRFYAYFSSYGTNSYDPNDVNFPSSGGYDEPGMMGFKVNYPLGSTISPAPNPYSSGLPIPTNGQSAQFINPKSFQILSPGSDGVYGFGGQYDASNTGDRLPGGNRTFERDNVSNFSAGAMD